MRILVTGGCDYVGSKLTEALLSRDGYRVTVLDATPSRSRPDRGVVRTLVEVLNQDRDVVMSLKPMNIFRRRGQP